MWNVSPSRKPGGEFADHKCVSPTGTWSERTQSRSLDGHDAQAPAWVWVKRCETQRAPSSNYVPGSSFSNWELARPKVSKKSRHVIETRGSEFGEMTERHEVSFR